ncbi:MAG: VWA domain-containing protein [Thermoanaerobaculia bacterium]
MRLVRSRARRTGFVQASLAAVGIAAALPAQSPPPGAAPPPIFGETVEVRVVNLEVVVTDRDNLPVTGLASRDFSIVIDGKAEPVDYFTEVRGGTAVEPEFGGEPAAAVPQLAVGSPVSTSYLVFVDDFFSIARDRNRVIGSLRKDLPRLGPEDRMAVVAWDGNRLTMLSSWSSSGPELERVLRKATERPAFGLQRLAEKRNLGNDQRLRRDFGALGQSRRFSLDARLDVSERYFAETVQHQVRSAAAAAAAALRGFANPPGRKVMLLLSGGWPYDPAEYAVNDFGRSVLEPDLDRGDKMLAPLVDTANQLGYTLYAVDVPGLGGDSDVDAAEATAPDLNDRAGSFLRENNAQYSLQFVAERTGGRALINARRDEALARAVADTRSYYWIGFTPQWQGDDSQHKVEVKVLRDGLRVRSRTGYLDSSKRREVSMAVESVLLFGNGPNAAPLPVEFVKGKSSGSTMRYSLVLHVPLDGLTFVPRGGEYETALELRVAAADDHGGRSDIPIIPMRLVVPQPPAPGSTARYQTQLELRRAKNHVVLAVYDPASGAIYSATADLQP